MTTRSVSTLAITAWVFAIGCSSGGGGNNSTPDGGMMAMHDGGTTPMMDSGTTTPPPDGGIIIPPYDGGPTPPDGGPGSTMLGHCSVQSAVPATEIDTSYDIELGTNGTSFIVRDNSTYQLWSFSGTLVKTLAIPTSNLDLEILPVNGGYLLTRTAYGPSTSSTLIQTATMTFSIMSDTGAERVLPQTLITKNDPSGMTASTYGYAQSQQGTIIILEQSVTQDPLTYAMQTTYMSRTIDLSTGAIGTPSAYATNAAPQGSSFTNVIQVLDDGTPVTTYLEDIGYYNGQQGTTGDNLVLMQNQPSGPATQISLLTLDQQIDTQGLFRDGADYVVFASHLPQNASQEQLLFRVTGTTVKQTVLPLNPVTEIMHGAWGFSYFGGTYSNSGSDVGIKLVMISPDNSIQQATLSRSGRSPSLYITPSGTGAGVYRENVIINGEQVGFNVMAFGISCQ